MTKENDEKINNNALPFKIGPAILSLIGYQIVVLLIFVVPVFMLIALREYNIISAQWFYWIFKASSLFSVFLGAYIYGYQQEKKLPNYIDKHVKRIGFWFSVIFVLSSVLGRASNLIRLFVDPVIPIVEKIIFTGFTGVILCVGIAIFYFICITGIRLGIKRVRRTGRKKMHGEIERLQ